VRQTVNETSHAPGILLAPLPCQQARIIALLGRSAALLALLLSAGCLQIDTKIKLNEDGSSTITERLNFSRQLLVMASGQDAAGGLERFLTREAALERMKRMGKGVTLVSHETREGKAGSKEAVTVYRVGYLGDFVYVSPFFHSGALVNELHCSMGPQLKWSEWRRRGVPPGSLIVSFREKAPKDRKAAPPPASVPVEPANPSPADLQTYRDLAPMFRDLLKGFMLRLTFESYCPIENYNGTAHRNFRVRPRTTDLIKVTDRDLDKYGYEFFENNEVMTDFLRWRLDTDSRSKDYSPFIATHIAGRQNNHTLPLLNRTWNAHFQLRPSRALFDRHLKGKTLDWGKNVRNRKHHGQKPARFEDVGWKDK